MVLETARKHPFFSSDENVLTNMRVANFNSTLPNHRMISMLFVGKTKTAEQYANMRNFLLLLHDIQIQDDETGFVEDTLLNMLDTDTIRRNLWQNKRFLETLNRVAKYGYKAGFDCNFTGEIDKDYMTRLVLHIYPLAFPC